MLTATLLVCALVALTGAQEVNNSSEVNVTDFRAASRCPEDWKFSGGRCHYFVSRAMSWVKSQQNCESLDANLASISSIDEQTFMKTFIQLSTGNNDEVWIGASDCQEEFVFFWIDGASFRFTNWCPNEPDNGGKIQHCVQFNYGADGCWDDLQCDSERPSVCTKAAE